MVDGLAVDEGSCATRVVGNHATHGGAAGGCLLYTSDAADERSSVDLGGRRIIKKKHRNRHARADLSYISRTRHKGHYKYILISHIRSLLSAST